MKADKTLFAAVAESCVDTVRLLLSDSSPFPKFRDEWVERGKPIAASYVSGAITKRQMIKRYQDRNTDLCKAFFLLFLRQRNEASDAIMRDIYERARALAAAKSGKEA